MTRNIVIGIGGTGAKVVEAMLHLSAAGFGPEEMSVGFVDQDKSNGNTTRAAELLNLLIRARGQWRTSANPHYIAPSEEIPLLRTVLSPLNPGEAGESSKNVWIPDESGQTKLTTIFGDMNEDQHLFDLLFSDAEQNMSLDEGYRGNPHIGSAAITARAQIDDSGFWAKLSEAIGSAGGGGQVRLLLAGSVFGGTGAAGFPTVARIIRDELKRRGYERNVSVGGVLMLPYFTFGDPKKENNEEMALTSELLTQSRGALRHYQWQLEQMKIFDQLYLVGWNHPYHLQYHSVGRGDQKNPALLPELIAAGAGYRFFDEADLSEDRQKNTVLVSSRHDDFALEWTDIPSVQDNYAHKFYDAIGQFLRFAGAFKQWTAALETQSSRDRVRKSSWYKQQLLDAVDWDESYAGAFAELNAVIDRFLLWAGAIEAYASRSSSFNFGLWRLGKLVTPPRFDTPWDLLDVNKNFGGEDYFNTFSSVLRHDGRIDDPLDATVLANLLSEDRAEGEHAGVGQLIASVYAFSSPTLNS